MDGNMMTDLHPHANVRTMVGPAEISLLLILSCISTAVGSHPYFAGNANATTGFLLLRIDITPG